MVVKYGCESWTVNKNLMKRINAFFWKDKVPNKEVLKRVGEKNGNSSGKLCNRNWHMLDMC